ncbi:MAG TPA: response regulator [Flavipsychrobacter sp.]|nr:response regulator [Flavipsychrobacter sp.]
MNTVVVIDDEDDFGLLLKSYFSKRGYNVHLATNLQSGLSVLEELGKIDIVFLDNNLPDGNGWEKAALLAKKFPNTYFFLASAYHPALPLMPEDVNYQFLEKPLSFGKLDQILNFNQDTSHDISIAS